MAKPRFLPANVRDISSWANNCLSATVAEHIVDQLDQNLLSDETLEILGRLMRDFYVGKQQPERAGLTPTQLKALLISPEIYPIDWQFILGVLFRDLIEQADALESDKAKKFIAADGQVSPRGFGFLAEKLKINVEFFVKGTKEGEIISAADVVVKAQVEELVPASHDKRPSAAPLVVYYKPGKQDEKGQSGHFARLLSDSSRLSHLKERDDQMLVSEAHSAGVRGGSFTKAIVESRDAIAAKANLKLLVKQRIVEVCTVQASASPRLDEKAPKPSSSTGKGSPTPASAAPVSGSMLAPVATKAHDPLPGPKPAAVTSVSKTPLNPIYVPSAYEPAVTASIKKVTEENKAESFEKAYTAALEAAKKKTIVLSDDEKKKRLEADLNKGRVISYLFTSVEKSEEKLISVDEQIKLDYLLALSLHNKP